MYDPRSNLNYRHILFFVVGLSITGASTAYCQDTIPKLGSSDIPGGTISRMEYFDGNSLWGYIDGGADLYMEYGFLKMLVQEIHWQGHHFTINLYRMKDSEAAFGILAVGRHRCLAGDSVARWSCVTPYQVQVARGTHYLSIINDNGTKEEQSLAVQIARTILSKLAGQDFKPPALFSGPACRRFGNNLTFMRGILGIQNGFPDWQALFGDVNNFSLYLLPVETEEGFLRTALVVFSVERDKQNFYTALKVKPPEGKPAVTMTVNGLTRTVKELTPMTIIFTETNLDREKARPYLEEIDSPSHEDPR